MMYLTGASNELTRELASRLPLGLMIQPGNSLARQIPDYKAFAADNGCFAAGATFQPELWLEWLNALPRAGCLFAVAPDVLGDHAATVARSAPYLDRIRAMRFKAAFVAQDGAVEATVPWDELDVLFTGGSTAWKLSESAYALQAAARARGKWTHMGRVNSWRRLIAAAKAGYDSVDGTFVAYGPNVRTPELERWIAALESQPVLS